VDADRGHHSFTDVFLLIVSLAYYDRYEYVFRNVGFVISTVLLRVSLSTPKPYDVVLALIAMLYGLAVLGVFSCFAAIERRESVAAAADSFHSLPRRYGRGSTGRVRIGTRSNSSNTTPSASTARTDAVGGLLPPADG